MRNIIISGIVGCLMMGMAVSLLAQGMVDLNSAGSSELEKLNRVGPKIAAKIIIEREKNGPFVSLDDVGARIKEIGPKTIAKWEGMVVVIPSAAE